MIESIFSRAFQACIALYQILQNQGTIVLYLLGRSLDGWKFLFKSFSGMCGTLSTFSKPKRYCALFAWKSSFLPS